MDSSHDSKLSRLLRQAAHQGRGPPRGGGLRQAARVAARDAADKRSVMSYSHKFGDGPRNVRLSSNSASIAASRQVT